MPHPDNNTHNNELNNLEVNNSKVKNQGVRSRNTIFSKLEPIKLCDSQSISSKSSKSIQEIEEFTIQAQIIESPCFPVDPREELQSPMINPQFTSLGSPKKSKVYKIISNFY